MQDRNAARESSSSEQRPPSAAGAAKSAPGEGVRVQLRALPYDAQVQCLAPKGEAPPGGGTTQAPGGANTNTQAPGGAPGAPGAPAAAVTGLDSSSVERWIQTALNVLIGAGLAVDGVLAGPTKQAVMAFQRKAPQLTGDRLTVDGVAGPRTIGALEHGTKSAAPTTHEPPKAPDASSQKKDDAPGGGGGGAGALLGAGAEGAAESLPHGLVENQVKAEINNLGNQAKKGADPVADDMSKAYDQARAWTMERHDKLDNKRALVTKEALQKKFLAATTKYEEYQASDPKKGRAPPNPGASESDYILKNWFTQYWMLWCYQFAQKVSEFLDGKKAVGLARLVETQTADAAAKGEADKVKGRTTFFRGMTMAQAGQILAADQKVAPGTSFHVKLHYEGDNPYEFKDDFHHWMVYAGKNQFSDTLTGKDKPGASHDAALRGWVKKSFSMGDYAFMHDDPRFTAEKRNGKPVPLPDLQPRISAEYDPRQSVKQVDG